MVLRSAVVVPVMVTSAVLSAALTLLATRSRSAESTVDVAPAMPARPAPSVASAPPATPPGYVRPVGAQYLGDWSQQLAAADLASRRYGWELPRLAEAMAQELEAVLDEGCRTHACTAEVERTRASVRSFVDGEAGTRAFGAPRVRRWTTNTDVPEDHHRVEITGRVDATTIDVECTCTSRTIGMRSWNDIAECEATLRDHDA